MDANGGWDSETLESCLDAFANELRSQNASRRTVEARVGHLVAYRRHAGQDPRDVSRADVVAWLGRPHLSPNSRHTYFGHLRAWTLWLAATQRIPADPLLNARRPRGDKLTPMPVSLDVVNRLLDATEGRAHTYVVLEAFAGLRAHEVAKIRGQDVTLDEVVVRGKGNRRDSIPLHPLVAAEAERYPAIGWWFPSPTRLGHVGGQSVTVTMTRAFTRIGMKGHGHQLRAFYATSLLHNGHDIETVRTLMRHESLESTQRYVATTDARRRNAILSLGTPRPAAAIA